MVQPTTPTAEAAERLGEALTINVGAAVTCANEWATAVGAAANPSSPPQASTADALSRSIASAWLGSLRATAVTAAAVFDAAAILSIPPDLVEHYEVDLAELFPIRTLPMSLEVTAVAWEGADQTGTPPMVSIVEKGPIALPPAGSRDVATLRVRPALTEPLSVTIEFTTVGDPDAVPLSVPIPLLPGKNIDP